MRRAACVLLLAAACSGSPGAAPSHRQQPVRHQTVRGRFWPQGVAFLNGREGVLVGWGSTPCREAHCRSQIETTQDGGGHWQVRVRIHGLVDSVSRVPGGGVIATVRRRGLLASGDGGRIWRWITHRWITAPSFATSTAGWALAPTVPDTATGIAVTQDGGRSWRTMPDPCRSAPLPDSISAISRSAAYLLCSSGNPAGPFDPKQLLRTDDGGRSWRVVDAVSVPGQVVPVAAHGLPPDGDFPHMVILPSLRGWLWADRGVLDRTDDGEHWRTVSRVIQPDVTSFVSAAFISATHGFALLWGSSATHLIRTSDGGRRWTTIHSWPG